MKKYSFTFLIAIIIGFFLSCFFLNQYNNFDGITVSSAGENVYFIQYGVFSSLESMEKETISLTNYIYSEIENLYYVYIGITRNSEIANKIVNYYKNLGYETIIKKYQITNKEILKIIDNYDTVMLKTDDSTTISSLINQVLIEYDKEEINGKNKGYSN